MILGFIGLFNLEMILLDSHGISINGAFDISGASIILVYHILKASRPGVLDCLWIGHQNVL